MSPNLGSITCRPPVPAWGGGVGAPDPTNINVSIKPRIEKVPTPTTPHRPRGISGSSTGGGIHRPGAPTLPITLSLSEDERSPNRSSSDSIKSPEFPKSAGAQGPEASPKDADDLLYEYFPLSLDDWYVC